jgi:chemotaxis protein MotB
MAGHGGKKKGRRRGHDDHGEHADERWLLTYSDLITLLMALFMVLFSISSVNKSKFESLQHALQDAFSGRILPGGKSIKEAGGTDNVANPSPEAPESSLQPYVGGKPKEETKSGGKTNAQTKADAKRAAEAAEQEQFRKLQAKINALVAAKGLSGKVQTKITDDGLVIRILTDKVLFDSGSAAVQPPAYGLLRGVAGVLSAGAADHQLIIQGHTDSQPIHSAQYPSNLELSSARADAVWHVFDRFGLDPAKMTAAGRGEYKPIASNATPGGRSLNRRVEILVPRTIKETGTTPDPVPDPIPSIRPDFAPGNR